MLLDPPDLGEFKAQAVQVDAVGTENFDAQPDELGVVKVADGQGAIHQT